MISEIKAIFVPIVFEGGISAGESTDMNLLTVAQDGAGRYVLRGTTISGVLRQAERTSQNSTREWFGIAADDNGRQAANGISHDSLVIIDTAILDCGKSHALESTHHLRNRHTGVVTKGGLFSVQSCPPGTTSTIAIWTQVPSGKEDQATELANLSLIHISEPTRPY